MQTSITLAGVASMFAAMAVLAAIPGVSVATVSARAAASGFRHGVIATLGVVAGDILFILIAMSGLILLAETMGDLFALVKLLGGGYLVWLGVSLLRSSGALGAAAGRADGASALSSFLAGAAITLGDQKAILFYFGFLPAFVDLSAASWVDAGVVIVTAGVAVGGVKIGYAYMADRGRGLLRPAAAPWIRRARGGMISAIGGLLLVSALAEFV